MTHKSSRTIELDVRPYLRQKLEPFQLIMEHVKKLEADDTFVLHATFKPTPLLGKMKMRGFAYKTEQIDKEHWVVTFVNKTNKSLLDQIQQDEKEPAAAQAQETHGDGESNVYRLDNRGLEPPQPMMRTLGALGKCSSGDKVVIHNDRVPVFLIEELNSLGYPFTIEDQEDGSAKVTIQKV